MNFKYFKDQEGNLIGAFSDGCEYPTDGIEVPPPGVDQVWSSETQSWVSIFSVPQVAGPIVVERSKLLTRLVELGHLSLTQARNFLIYGYTSTAANKVALELQWLDTEKITIRSELFDDFVSTLGLDPEELAPTL